MTKKSGLVAVALTVFVSWASAAEEDREKIAEGLKIAERICATCHAIGKEGTSPHASAPPFRVIAGKGPPENLEEALGEGIAVGHPDMPQFKFGPRQVGAIVAYLNWLRQRS